jgi:hypothetical protein
LLRRNSFSHNCGYRDARRFCKKTVLFFCAKETLGLRLDGRKADPKGIASVETRGEDNLGARKPSEVNFCNLPGCHPTSAQALL